MKKRGIFLRGGESTKLELSCLAAIALAWLIGTTVFAPSGRTVAHGLIVAIGGFTVQVLVSAWGMSPNKRAGTRTYEASQAWIGGASGAAAAFVIGRVIPVDTSIIELIFGGFLGALSLAIVQEYLDARATGKKVRRAALIGTGEETQEWFDLLNDHPEIGVELVGCIGDEGNARRVGLADKWLGSTDDLLHILDSQRIDLPIVAVSSFRRPAVQQIVDQLLAADHDVAISWGVGRISSRRLGSVVFSNETLPIIRAQRPQVGAQRTKRFIDIVVAAGMLTITAPIIAIAAVMVKRQSPGPAFFKQQRVGRDGEQFSMIKLRTMVVDAEDMLKRLQDENERKGPLFKMDRDPRVTRIGNFLRKTSLDELPQLLNVLRGEMSLVGPRPALLSETADFDQELNGRHKVRPGLTGLWQVEARHNESFAAYRRLDLHYLENWSLGLDFRIIISTAQMLGIGALVSPFAKRAANQEESLGAEAAVVAAAEATLVAEAAAEATIVAEAAAAAATSASSDTRPVLVPAPPTVDSGIDGDRVESPRVAS